MYKVFHNHKAIVFSNDTPFDDFRGIELNPSSNAPEQIAGLFKNDSDPNDIWVKSPDIDLMFNSFSAQFEPIEAAGGLVKNPEGNFLFIHRLGKWDLPKGKIEKKESPQAAAIREVIEECSVGGLSIISNLPVTYHIYSFNHRWLLKKTFWFEMYCLDWQNPKPQTEEDIQAVEWISASQEPLQTLFSNTYRSLLEVFKYYWPMLF